MPADDNELRSTEAFAEKEANAEDGSQDRQNQEDRGPDRLTRRAFVGTAAMASASLVSAANAFGQYVVHETE